jgi:aminoglycoside phosphotransferase (APT) family kinase protein
MVETESVARQWHRFSIQDVTMCAAKMHDDEVDIDVSLVRRLVAAQFPQWAGLPIRPVRSSGTANALYRLGTDMAVRLPRTLDVTGEVEKEHEWLPVLAPLLPLAIPIPLGKGGPDEGYPGPWSVYRWLEGDTATIERISHPEHAARELAQFITALERIDPDRGPHSGMHNFGRGVPLAMRDERTRAAIVSLNDTLDTVTVTAAWDASLGAPTWDGPAVWIHGDLLPNNLLVDQGRLSAVIDFAGLGVGDPACDMLAAWSLFSGRTREQFRAALSVDDATWIRGRGWALSVALIALPYYRNTNPEFTALATHMIDEVLADHRDST